MKSICILLTFIVTTLHAQNSNENFQKNSTRGSIYFLTFPFLKSFSINQERYFKKNMSFDVRVSYLSLSGDSFWDTKSIIFGPKWYIPAPKNNFCNYWMQPNILWRNYYHNSQSGTNSLDYYHIGASIGKRHFIIQDTFFWDIGIGVSYGIGIYRFYTKFDTEGHDNIYEFHPRFICNFGWKY